jgi:hypothetical protein
MHDDFSKTYWSKENGQDFVDEDSPFEILARTEDAADDPLAEVNAAEAVSALLRALIGTQPPTPSKALAIGIRVLVLNFVLRPASMPGVKSLAELAARLECTRASTSWHARQLEQIFGTHFRPQKCAGTVETFSQVQMGNRNAATKHRSARPRLDRAKTEINNQDSSVHVRHLTSDN